MQYHIRMPQAQALIFYNLMFLKKLINKGYEAQCCELCLSPFKLIKFDRIHKCKRCLKFICISCGDSKQFVIDEEGKMTAEKHRVCTKCKSDIQLIKQSMDHYGLKWNRNSRLSLEWLDKLQGMAIRSRQNHQVDYEYQHFLRLFFKAGSKFDEETEIIDKDVIRGRTDFSVFNYSMKEFFYTVQLGVEDQHTTRLNIANVLYGVAARFDKIGYCQGMSGIAAFLLCFAEEESAYIIFCDLLEHIFPSMFFARSNFGVALIGLLAEIHFLKEFYEHYVKTVKKNLLLKEREGYSQDEINHFKVIIELAGTKSLLSIFIGILNFSNLLFVWEELKSKRSFQVVEKAFLAIIYLNRNAILQQRSFKKLQEYFQKLDGESFREAYHDIQIDQQQRRQHIQDFLVQNNKKWNSSGTGSAYTLSKVTNLTENEIKILEKYFCTKFSMKEMIEKAIVSEQEFASLVGVYYQVLKRESGQGESILEISPYFLKKIFKSYVEGGREGLIFREFICCFSICTKSTLKERICAIITTFKDYDCNISHDNFSKLILSIISLAPARLELKKGSFLSRMERFFQRTGKITLSQLEILLNDEFIFEMNQLIAFSSEDIVNKTLAIYEQQREARPKQDEPASNSAALIWAVPTTP